MENDECYQICKKEESQKIIAILLSLIKKQENLNSENFKKLVMMIQDDTKIKGKNLWMPIRLAITGQMHGPDIGSIVEILGRDEVIRRIQINE